MMIQIVLSIDENEDLDIPLPPLVWALALGACLGGKNLFLFCAPFLFCPCLLAHERSRIL